jgi:hypothetical protein
MAELHHFHRPDTPRTHVQNLFAGLAHMTPPSIKTAGRIEETPMPETNQADAALLPVEQPIAPATWMGWDIMVNPAPAPRYSAYHHEFDGPGDGRKCSADNLPELKRAIKDMTNAL